MFNGIIEDLGIVKKVTSGEGKILVIESELSKTLKIGDSIAINGVCVTVTSCKKNQFTFFISHETLSITTLGSLKVLSKVNLERSMVYGERISGHLLYGHVDKTLKLFKIQKGKESSLLTFRICKADYDYLILKGSIAIDGISLTIYDLESTSFTLMIIPHTWEKTNLSFIKEGGMVNCEFDNMGKFFKKYLENYLSKKL